MAQQAEIDRSDATTQIARIDREVDAVRRELRRRARFDIMSAAGWQSAWDRHPDLAAKHTELFVLRGHWQVIRNQVAPRAKRASPPRVRRCPTCRAHTLVEARA